MGVGRRGRRGFAAADNRSFVDLYCAALASGERQEADLQLALPGGKGGWRRTVVVPVDSDTITVVTRDISRERYFETAVEQERGRLRALADGSDITDLSSSARATEGRFAGWSAAALFAAACSTAREITSAFVGPAFLPRKGFTMR